MFIVDEAAGAVFKQIHDRQAEVDAVPFSLGFLREQGRAMP